MAAGVRKQKICGLSRGLFCPANVFHFILVLSCTSFSLAICGPCPINRIQESVEHDACGSYGDNQRVGFHDILSGDTTGYTAGSLVTHPYIDSVCTNSKLLCFPSTLFGFLSEELKLKRDALEISRIQSDSALSVGTYQTSSGASNRTGSLENGIFKLLDGKTVLCILSSKESNCELSSIAIDKGNQNGFSLCRQTLLNEKSTNVRLRRNSEFRKRSSVDVFSSPKVEINPPLLDWGQKYLLSPSVVFLTIANSFNDSILHVYEPFSTNSQFYPCNFSEILLGPGEVASICFVFLPRWLGLSTAHLILQTSSGGFLVPAKGLGIESPYNTRPLLDLDVLSSRRLSKNLSVFNPYDEILHVEGVTAWISVSVGNTTHYTEATCNTESFQNSDEFSFLSLKDWLVVRSGQASLPLMATRPNRIWEIGPHSSETIIEIDFLFGLEGKNFGAFCIELLMSPYNVSDAIMVPLEVDLGNKAAHDDLTSPVSVSLEPLVSSAARRSFVAISLRNGASYMLNVVRIGEVGKPKIFQIKYLEGLLLFPGTVTQVAVITCTQLPVELHDSLPEASNINRNCKLIILTNDSNIPQIEIACQDVIHVCSRCQNDSSANETGNVEAGSMRRGSLDGGEKVSSEIKVLETAEADDLVLGNWKSQGTTSGMSVLDDHEILFPMVQIGSHRSKWITVKNPSQQPVVMQLILNSGEIIDECRDADGFVEPPSSGSLFHGKSSGPTRFGFSMADSALTEAYVHPHGRVSFGPIFFHPSNRCAWRSSALIRNNLSGVEWLSLRGFGGSLSLVLFEGSDPIESVEFNLNLPLPLNMTSPNIVYHMEETTSACSHRLSKELYAKNTGDLPLEVRSIKVSGVGCRLDGFFVHTCNGFSLEPGESSKLLISYQTDFSAAMVHRDIELALSTGIFVIPMKASIPNFTLNLCKKSVFSMRLKKLSITVLHAAFLMFLVFFCLYLQVISTGYEDYFYRSEKSSIAAIRTAGKSSRLHPNQRSSRNSVPSKTDYLLRSVDEDETSEQASSGRYPDSSNGSPEEEMTTYHAVLSLESHGHTSSSSDTQKGKGLRCLPSKSVVLDTSDTVEAPHTDNLTARVGKEKGRRRRKRKGAVAILTGGLEVSSSQSGNSTPSSPLSPVTSSTLTLAGLLSSDVDQPNDSRYLFTQKAEERREKSSVSELAAKPKILETQLPVRYHRNKEYSSTPGQSSVPRKTASKPELLPSATFPCAGRVTPSLLCSSPALASTSMIAPHARAPGSNLYQKTLTGQTGLRDEYRYDIWGDHFSQLSLIGRSKYVNLVNYNDANSFFVSGPQTLVKNSQSRSVSCFNRGG